MSRQEPVNIRRLVQQNDQYTSASTYAKSLTTGNSVSKWHEKNFAGGRGNVGDCLTTHAQPADTCTSGRANVLAKQLAEELRQANLDVLSARKARMQELIQSEQQAYEAELSAMGMALAKRRD